MKHQTYKFRTTPYKHQVAALKKLFDNKKRFPEGQGGGALLMQPRTGKTKIAIDYAAILHARGKCDRVVVICPVSVMHVWVDEIRMHCPCKFRITFWDKRTRKKMGLPKYGSGALDFVIMNYDAFSTPGRIISKDPVTKEIKRSRTRGGRFDIKRQILAWQPHLLILDESHRIKSTSAKKTYAILAIRKVVPYRLILTGTAVTKAKRIFDLYPQWKFWNPESPLVKNMTLAEFKEKYGKWTRRNGYPQLLRPRNETRLHRLLHAEAFAVTRDECFDLPEAYPPKIIPVPLEESARIYDEMAEKMVAELKAGEYTEASIRLVQNLRFTQITSGLAKTVPTQQYPEGRWVRIGREKLRVLADLLEDWKEEDEKVVICARFRADIVSIAKLCDKLKLKRFILWGGMKPYERQAAIKNFKEWKGSAAFIMNPQAGSLGIDLRSASTMVWYSLINSYVDFIQSMDRIALSGKANRFYFLLAEGTYDEILYEVLQTDGDIVQALHESPERLLRNFKTEKG